MAKKTLNFGTSKLYNLQKEKKKTDFPTGQQINVLAFKNTYNLSVHSKYYFKQLHHRES